MACTCSKQLCLSEYQFTVWIYILTDRVEFHTLQVQDWRWDRVWQYKWIFANVCYWPVGTRRMTSTNAANQGWPWLNCGREKPWSFGSLGRIGRMGLLAKLLEGSGTWEVWSECWAVRLGSWRAGSGSFDARWRSFWSSSPPPPRQWSRGARRRPPATMGIRLRFHWSVIQ